jgi:uncharacterized hydrophobic protein (TIGR00271 family)
MPSTDPVPSLPIARDAEPADVRTAARAAIVEGAGFDRPFVISNLAATVIAAAGLLGDSSVTVIGAMLVATMVGPILGIGLALVELDDRLLARALRTLAVGTVLVLCTGALAGLVTPQLAPTSEMLSRTTPHLVDLVVALASGAVCAYAIATPRLNAAIIGVAIAVALVPPLTTAGLFAARGEWEPAGGAALLAFVNMVAIQVGASATLWLCGFRGRRRDAPGLGTELRRQAVSLLLLGALALTLGAHGLKLVRQRRFEAAVTEAVQLALRPRPGASLVRLELTTRDGRAVATAIVRTPERLTPSDVAALERHLPPAPDGSSPRLSVRHVEVDVVGDGR